ncbi:MULTISPECIES: argininosuccinate lyase [unclassified Pseudomonas]|uniref:argininosuccinate lyase n=1 Tax=unclassified Pseudomonas TaxID=196821 RepID=UPI000C86AD81|nr:MULTISPECIES: argininosuccinate lyase [unclassified Pseudomonas]PMU23333.1 argininosuccinate lyase [Pseudomonas sp. GP01-A9]PMU24771.1 argininosuccinate lyase [Pseudomonas sp. GP01-A13]PMU37819.1 argininosuccinate lyase [Pseudomonas sp. GP01-A8]PMU48237.1 argininosuccinate lyase [Pseudomonas sp. GP01-A14]PMU50916.1 argininosuccinate lyase [Pseudomonas sp. GP01-A6]
MSQPTDRLWGARFKSGPSAALAALSRCPERYFRLTPYDLAGSRAHARELQRAGLLDESETLRTLEALDRIGEDFAAGRLHPTLDDEDVHTFIERVLTERLGALGGKLRAGRSRNDQTANDLRLFLRDHARTITTEVLGLQQALVDQAEQHIESICPGFTHLQQAQPIVFAHHLLAHAQSMLRDVQRLVDWDARTALSPLGAAAMAGSAIARQPEHSAKEMGYAGPCENSIDAVASRDHVAEFLFVAGMLGVNISRLSEEFCLWSSRQFRWVQLDDAYATGSSIMPQKKNPDIAELARGKAGRLIGNLTGLMSTLKSLPLSYNRDLSEDKHSVLDSVDTLLLVLPAMAGMVATMKVQVEELRRQAPMGFTLATEVADWLATRGVPFKEAHEITGALVQACEKHEIELWEASPALLADVDTRLTPQVRECLTLEAAIAARNGWGGTAPERVREQIGRLKTALAVQQEWAQSYTGFRI